MSVLTRADVIESLSLLPDQIMRAEERVAEAIHRRLSAKENLDGAEAEVLLDGERITGRNAEQRAAQVFLETRDARRILEAARRDEDALAIRLRHVQNRFAAARSLARLLAGGDDA